jgi:uncharacterized membrane protein YgcG
MTDIYHMIGIVPTDRKKLKEKLADRKQDRLLYGNPGGLKRRSLAELRDTPLHQLPDDDLEIIMEAEDEFRRLGHFTKLFPCKNVKYYSQFFSSPRYNNVILEKWIVEQDWSVLARFMTEQAIEERWAECRKLQMAMTEQLAEAATSKQQQNTRAWESSGGSGGGSAGGSSGSTGESSSSGGGVSRSGGRSEERLFQL